jgi:hypothetical protein
MGQIAGVPETSSNLTSRAENHLGAFIFVWSVWIVMFITALAFVAKYGCNIPKDDEWCYLVPFLTGERPVTLENLWSQYNQHRFFIPRLLSIGLAKLTHNDFRAGMYFNVLILGAVSGGLIAAAKGLRGKYDFADAFFPLSVLHCGNSENLLMGMQTNFILFTGLAGFLLITIARHPTSVPWRRSLAAGVALLCLLLSGGFGLVMAPWLGLWFAWDGAMDWVSGQSARKWRGAGKFAFVVVLMVTAIFYLHGLDRPTESGAGWGIRVKITLECMATALGAPSALQYWPYSAWVVPALLIPSVALVLFSGWRDNTAQFQSVGFLCFLGAIATICLGIGWGRTTWGDQIGFGNRYQAMSVPVLWGIYFTWVIYGPRRVSAVVPMVLFTLVATCLLVNTTAGVTVGRSKQHEFKGFQRDLLAGTPNPLLTALHGKNLFQYMGSYLSLEFTALHKAKIGIFQYLNDPPVVEEPCLLEGAWGYQMSRNGNTWVGTGKSPMIVIQLPKPQFVTAIRLQYSFDNGRQWPQSSIFWRESTRNDFIWGRRDFHFSLVNDPVDHSILLPINDTIDQIRLDPDCRPCQLRLEGVWLVKLANPPERLAAAK